MSNKSYVSQHTQLTQKYFCAILFKSVSLMGVYKLTIEELSGKQRVLLPGLMICLVDHWTHTLNPEKDLKDLSIGPDIVRGAIHDLIERRYLKKSALQILTQPEKFREAEILTERGKKARADFNLDRIVNFWRIAYKDAKFMALMQRSGVG